jgi:DNA polymerase III psi subunit
MQAHITEQQRRQYLHAMGIEPLVCRGLGMAVAAGPVAQPAVDEHFSPAPGQSADTAEACYEIGPGAGSTLLLCDSREQAASPLASDIARCLDEVPVWGWNVAADQQDARAPAFTLESAIRDRLFTRVLLFSDAGYPQALVIGSARIIRAPALPQLANDPQQKRVLWSQLTEHGWAGRRS